MSGEKTPSKDEALEAMDFIVNVLKEHEKDLDRLIGELDKITEQLGETGEISDKVKKIELKIDTIQTEIVNLVKRVSSSPLETPASTATTPTKGLKTETIQNITSIEAPVLLQCKNWEDFQSMATGAQTLSYSLKENERTFEANALKNNQVITYVGELPKTTSLLKMWLSKQLDVSEKRILEGDLALG